MHTCRWECLKEITHVLTEKTQALTAEEIMRQKGGSWSDRAEGSRIDARAVPPVHTTRPLDTRADRSAATADAIQRAPATRGS
jgi:hypothetical protein